jgi:hypothetical protein
MKQAFWTCLFNDHKHERLILKNIFSQEHIESFNFYKVIYKEVK